MQSHQQLTDDRFPVGSQIPDCQNASLKADGIAESALPKNGDAPFGNTNSAKHGLRSKRIFRAKLGKLPAKWRQAGRNSAELRKYLEAEVQTAFGEIGVVNALAVNRACRWERVACLALRFLTDNPDLPPAERLAFLQTHGRATNERDKAVETLRLPASDAVGGWDSLKLIETTEPEGSDDA